MIFNGVSLQRVKGLARSRAIKYVLPPFTFILLSIKEELFWSARKGGEGSIDFVL